MPNHVTNELIFRALTDDERRVISANVLNAEGHVDFEYLLPIPLNYWMGSVGTRHEKAFKNTALDWCKDNWGTKWNAYDCKPVEADGPLRLVFNTAWRPPYGWIVAVFNRFKVSFDHNWLDEGEGQSHCGRFDHSKMDDMGDPWTEVVADDTEYRRMHKMKWGVESFEDEDESEA